jgi:hypothetical protein
MELRIARGHGGNPSPSDVRFAAEAALAALPADLEAPHHRLTLYRALNENLTARKAS